MTTKTASQRKALGFLSMAGRHSAEAEASTERMITLCRLAGVTITTDEIETLRGMFATIGQRVDDMIFDLR